MASLSPGNVVSSASGLLPRWPPNVVLDNDEGMGEAVPKQQMFHDPLVGHKSQRLKIPEDLLTKKLVTIDYVDANLALPRIFIANSIMAKLCKGWENTMIVKLL